jgi:hypothetical protein
MQSTPVVVIASRSPLLEGIARAVLSGVAGGNATSSTQVVVADSTASLAPALSAPFVFVGYRADSEESRRTALRALNELADRAPSLDHVALFEASIRGPEGDSMTGLSAGPSAEVSPTPEGAPLERFTIDRGPLGEFTESGELTRARDWGAQTYADWLSNARRPPTEDARRDSIEPSPRIVPWCGAAE